MNVERVGAGWARRSVCIAILALLAGSSGHGSDARQAAGSQAPASRDRQPAAEQQQPPPRPTFRTEANYVRVDAYPTRDGQPVLDLSRDDFEVLEDGAPQRVEQFELVRVQVGTSQAERREPQTVAESREMAREPRSRVFVIFLDTYHTGVAGSHRMRTALTTLLHRMLGPDDLVGVMTPEMSARDVTLARRTDTIEEMLSEHWDWGQRDRLVTEDPVERDYEACYPDAPGSVYEGVAREMIERRREKLALDALDDLAVHLRDMREERKAVLAVSDGWLLYGPNPSLTRLDDRDRPPGPGAVGVGPSGRITSDTNLERYGTSRNRCEADRQMLSVLDNERDFRNILDRANRSNVSYYTIDSRGLVVFDSSISNPLPPALDSRVLRRRLDSLQVLADNTDGMAVINSNNIEAGLARVAADLSSYYLLGYYSTNAKLDGRFRSITVRVKRPGVQVRARRGYLAATEAEVAAGETASAPAPAAAPSAVDAAIAGLGSIRSDARVHTHVAWLVPGTGDAASAGRVWAVAELDRGLANTEWQRGGTVDATLLGAGGATLASQAVEIAPGQRTADLAFADVPLDAGDVVLRLRLTPAAGGLPMTESVRFAVRAGGSPVGTPRVWRRGPATGLQHVPTGSAAFRRNEHLRLEWPVAGRVDAMSGELLDRTGRVLPVPVTTRAVDPAAPDAWPRGDLALAPLAAGDYAVRVTFTVAGQSHQSVTGFRIVP